MNEKVVDQVICGCCGKYHDDTPETNNDYNERGQDTGYGLCTSCYGEPALTYQDIKAAQELDGEEAVWKMLGWANETFYQSRIKIMSERLNDENRGRFERLQLWKQIAIIQDALGEGLII